MIIETTHWWPNPVGECNHFFPIRVCFFFLIDMSLTTTCCVEKYWVSLIALVPFISSQACVSVSPAYRATSSRSDSYQIIVQLLTLKIANGSFSRDQMSCRMFSQIQKRILRTRIFLLGCLRDLISLFSAFLPPSNWISNTLLYIHWCSFTYRSNVVYSEHDAVFIANTL